MTEKSEKIKGKIQKYEITNDNLTSRAGLNFFVKYLEQIKIYGILLSLFGFLRKTKKGSSINQIFKQIFCFFFDGTYKKIEGFNRLSKDKGYASVIENRKKEMCSSSSIKRFYEKFTLNLNWLFDKILIELFIWRLKIQMPKIIELFVDTFVLKNHYSQKREGVEWTYKRSRGYQPLNIIWKNLLVSTILRNGNKHALSEKTAQEKIKKIVKIIRKRYSSKVPIIIKMDAGFLSEELFSFFDNLGIYFIGIARWDSKTKEVVNNIIETLNFKKYETKKNVYSYTEFGYKYKSWKKLYRCIYTELHNNGNQYCLPGFREKTLILTNLKEISTEEYPEELKKYFLAEKIIELNNLRGSDELTHRGIKNFGTESLPFQKFNQNAAFYYTMVISYFLFECFKEDVLKDILPIGSYASTVRRKFVDIAGKIIKTSGKIILKISKASYEMMCPYKLIKNINNSIPLLT